MLLPYVSMDINSFIPSFFKLIIRIGYIYIYINKPNLNISYYLILLDSSSNQNLDIIIFTGFQIPNGIEFPKI